MNTAPHPPPNHRWRPGDLFVHPATADQDVEWLILPAGPETADLLVVAVDTEPLSGVGDLALPHDSPLAPLVIRCSASCRLDRSILDAAVPTGHLEEPWPRAALELSENFEQGTVRGTPLEREAEDDSELRYRRHVLTDARRRLAEAGAAGSAYGVVAGPWKLATAPAAASPTTTLWQAAAGILLAACLGLSWLSFDLARDRGPGDPGAVPVGELLNAGPTRSERPSVTAYEGAWYLHLMVPRDQASQGFTVEIPEPLGPATEAFETSVAALPESSTGLSSQVIVGIPESAATPGLHHVRLVARGSGEEIGSLDVILRPSPSRPRGAPGE